MVHLRATENVRISGGLGRHSQLYAQSVLGELLAIPIHPGEAFAAKNCVIHTPGRWREPPPSA